MGERIFLAGASGAVGRRLVPLLVGAGHRVTGTTRVAEKADELRALGAEPVIVDVFDAMALAQCVAASRPAIVIHQLTDLPRDLDPQKMPAALIRNARLRDEGTKNLVAAALASSARRFIAQSIAWVYARGAEPHREEDPLATAGEGERGVTIHGIVALEERVLNAPPLEGIVLRYGLLYGPGTPYQAAARAIPVHVDAAAFAALCAVDRGAPGIYNIAEANPHVATEKAERELSWRADFRLPPR
ncbi:MAG TPA: NAD(P)-dependent oxidoreductase [Stellaceae bacterium]|nr:NAD(P)-dependent oxidoreductase [Stellaceae bacterium]